MGIKLNVNGIWLGGVRMCQPKYCYCKCLIFVCVNQLLLVQVFNVYKLGRVMLSDERQVMSSNLWVVRVEMFWKYTY